MGLREDVLKDCERLGESEIRLKFAAKSWSDPAAAGIVEHWLEQKAAERSAAAEAKRDAREAESLAIAKEANRIAREANKFARNANIWAAIAAIIAATAMYLAKS